MTYIVALTGGIGSGKSTVSDAFARLGVPVVDADVIARQVVEPGTEALERIRAHFGPSAFLTDGSLNRKRLREVIFAQPEEKSWLNALLHPLIQKETRRQLAAVTAPYALWVVPLLIENGLCDRANRVLVVDVSENVQLQRLLARDGGGRQQAEQILASQASRAQRLACADDVILNDDSPEALGPQVERLHRRYLTLANDFNRQDPSI
ncbi:dephospho-CoA kinase [Leminorella grimontii]|uniref:dephospho-CoA kinase n=1 Tax=Leminorella grimontii TaxID=82981 RepID=UPI0020877CCA|nr:dephospho-CoA kinase [Leminorella grimontii]GKX60469.1 dephospho-CoA kinase [Leminorella grimontii]